MHKQHLGLAEAGLFERRRVGVVGGRLARQRPPREVGYNLEVVGSRLMHKDVVVQVLQTHETSVSRGVKAENYG